MPCSPFLNIRGGLSFLQHFKVEMPFLMLRKLWSENRCSKVAFSIQETQETLTAVGWKSSR